MSSWQRQMAFGSLGSYCRVRGVDVVKFNTNNLLMLLSPRLSFVRVPENLRVGELEFAQFVDLLGRGALFDVPRVSLCVPSLVDLASTAAGARSWRVNAAVIKL